MSRPISDAELEATLRDIGRGLGPPAAPQLAARVRARLAERPAARRPWPLVLAPALITLVVIAGGAAATEVVRLRGVEVFRIPAATLPPVDAPTASATPRPALDLGERATVAAAVDLLRPLYVSSDPVFSTPDEIYIRRSGNVQATFVYAPGPGLPAGPTGHGALVGQLRGTLEPSLIGKGIGPGTKIENVRVGGAPGLWIEGEAHLFFYRDAAGNILQETLRLAGNTLLWQPDGTLLRLEAQVGRERALEIATAFAPR